MSDRQHPQAAGDASIAGDGRSVAIITFGCQMNKYDSERLAGLLADAGYAVGGEEFTSDVVVFNTCCVRENADERLYGRLGALRPLKKERPDLQIAVGGCLAQKDREYLLKRAPHVDVVFGTHNASELPALLESARGTKGIVSTPEDGLSPEEEALSTYRQERVRAWLPISIGCDNFCSYCIVPHVRGRERSAPMETLVRRSVELARDGVLDLTLLGQNVNSYGNDFGGEGHFAELLARIDAENGLPRLRFMTSHPKDFSDRIIETLPGIKGFCGHIHLPVQSGSNRILKRMGRKYSSEWYLDRVQAIRSAMPDVSITTDIIVGFPGETDMDFQQTLDLVEQVRFDGAYTFIYSKRSGTAAAQMDDQIPAEISKERMDRLLAIQNPNVRRAMERQTGKELEVLVEGASKRDTAKLTGRTRDGKLVHFEADHSLIDTLVTVKIDAATAWSLRGTLVAKGA